MGALTVPMALYVLPGEAVATLEPQREIFQFLAANIALNALHNVHTYHCAVIGQPSEILVTLLDYEKGGNYGAISLGERTKEERIPCQTVDSMALYQCHMIKIDVEGMEGISGSTIQF